MAVIDDFISYVDIGEGVMKYRVYIATPIDAVFQEDYDTVQEARFYGRREFVRQGVVVKAGYTNNAALAIWALITHPTLKLAKFHEPNWIAWVMGT